MKKLLILLGALFTLNVKGQVINFVKYPHQADIVVKFVKYRWESDIVIKKVNNRWDANKPGLWYWDDTMYNTQYPVYNKLNVLITEYSYIADYRVYVTTNRWEIKVNDDYLIDLEEWYKRF